jgi:serine/threonine protein kinase
MSSANHAFANLIKKGITETNTIIDHLRADAKPDTDYFTDHSTSLPTASFKKLDNASGPDEGLAIIHHDGQSYTVKKIGKGGYGTIYKTESGIIYKVMKKQPHRTVEGFCKEVYTEAFIQTTLQADEEHGINIAKIENIYRDVSLVKKGKRRRNNGSKSLEPSYIFYYKMEYIPTDIDKYVKLNIEDERRLNPRANHIPYKKSLILFQYIARLLYYFQEKYGFYHQDLHIYNVMFNEDGYIKLIDFGMSCIKVKGVTYSLRNMKCFSYDLLLFLLSYYYIFKDYIDDTTNEYIYSLCTGNNEYYLLNELVHDALDKKRYLPYYGYISSMIGNNAYEYWKKNYERFVRSGIANKLRPEYIINDIEDTIKNIEEMQSLADAAEEAQLGGKKSSKKRGTRRIRRAKRSSTR